MKDRGNKKDRGEVIRMGQEWCLKGGSNEDGSNKDGSNEDNILGNYILEDEG